MPEGMACLVIRPYALTKVRMKKRDQHIACLKSLYDLFVPFGTGLDVRVHCKVQQNCTVDTIQRRDDVRGSVDLQT